MTEITGSGARASGQTIRAVLKAARQVSKGQCIMIRPPVNYRQARWFQERVADALCNLGYKPKTIGSHGFEWDNGGLIVYYPDTQREILPHFKEIKHL